MGVHKDSLLSVLWANFLSEIYIDSLIQDWSLKKIIKFLLEFCP